MSGQKKADGRLFARFGCNNCGASFHAQHGDTAEAHEWRCVACDHAELRPPGSGIHNGAVTCSKCGASMEQGLDPKCPRCESRDVVVLVPGMFFD